MATEKQGKAKKPATTKSLNTNSTVRAFDKQASLARSRAYARIIARCWIDEAFKARFIGDPTAVMGEYGIDVPSQTEVVVVENSPSKIFFIIPPAPGTVNPPHHMERQPIHIMDCPCDSANCSSPPSANCECVTCYTDMTGDSICSPSISG